MNKTWLGNRILGDKIRVNWGHPGLALIIIQWQVSLWGQWNVDTGTHREHTMGDRHRLCLPVYKSQWSFCNRKAQEEQVPAKPLTCLATPRIPSLKGLTSILLWLCWEASRWSPGKQTGECNLSLCWIRRVPSSTCSTVTGSWPVFGSSIELRAILTFFKSCERKHECLTQTAYLLCYKG